METVSTGALGRLFAKDEIRKFGIEKVFELIEECLPTDEECIQP